MTDKKETKESKRPREQKFNESVDVRPGTKRPPSLLKDDEKTNDKWRNKVFVFHYL